MDRLTRKTYRDLRDHQAALAADDAGMETTYPSGRTERSYASAAYGFHAAHALDTARFVVARRARREAAQ